MGGVLDGRGVSNTSRILAVNHAHITISNLYERVLLMECDLIYPWTFAKFVVAHP